MEPEPEPDGLAAGLFAVSGFSIAELNVTY